MNLQMTNDTSSSRYVVWAVGLMTVLAGILVLLPWYAPPTTNGLLAGMVFEFNRPMASALTVLAGVPALVGWIRHSYPLTKTGAFWLFSFYLFNSFSRIFVVGDFWNLMWIPSMIISVLLAIIYLFDKRSAVGGRR